MDPDARRKRPAGSQSRTDMRPLEGSAQCRYAHRKASDLSRAGIGGGAIADVRRYSSYTYNVRRVETR